MVCEALRSTVQVSLAKFRGWWLSPVRCPNARGRGAPSSAPISSPESAREPKLLADDGRFSCLFRRGTHRPISTALPARCSASSPCRRDLQWEAFNDLAPRYPVFEPRPAERDRRRYRSRSAII